MMIWLFLFTLWLFKKTVIADTFAEWATHWFDVTETLTFIDGWITSLSYTIQLYFDFSGYTDMALWIALLFNIVLPFNFDSPYKSLDIQDFWRRRHITLSRFLKDYIYIPLWWNRKWVSRTYVNLMLTFIIGWIWHGAGRTFIFWWLLHWGALCLHRYWKKSWSSMPNLFWRFLTFNFVNIAWIFFRALERWDALKVLQWMFWLSWFGEINTDIMYKIWLIILVLWLSIYGYNTNKIHDVEFKSYRYPIWFALLFLASLLAMSLIEHSEFIYFNF